MSVSTDLEDCGRGDFEKKIPNSRARYTD